MWLFRNNQGTFQRHGHEHVAGFVVAQQRVRVGKGDAEGDVTGFVVELSFNGLYYGGLIENFVFGH